MPRRHADEEKTIFAMVFTIIKALNGKRVFEYRSCQFETDTVGFQVRLGLDVVPFKFHVYYTTGNQ